MVTCEIIKTLTIKTILIVGSTLNVRIFTAPTIRPRGRKKGDTQTRDDTTKQWGANAFFFSLP